MNNIIQDGTFVYYEREGEVEFGEIEGFDHSTRCYKIRNKLGQIITKEQENVFTSEESMKEKIINYIKYNMRYFLYSGVALIIIALSIFAVESQSDKTRIRVLTEEINRLNTQNIPLIDSCTQLKKNDSEIKVKLLELNKLKGN